jgi:hypothetical protein
MQERERGAAAHRSLRQVGGADRSEQPLQAVVLEPVVEQVRERDRQGMQQFRHAAAAERAIPQAEARERQQLPAALRCQRER